MPELAEVWGRALDLTMWVQGEGNDNCGLGVRSHPFNGSEMLEGLS